MNNPIPAPVVVKTSDIRTGSLTAESYENMFVQVRNAVVTNPFADGASNFGEFSVDDGTGEVRVDDRSNLYRGQVVPTGIYFYRVQSGTFTEVKKMLVVR